MEGRSGNLSFIPSPASDLCGPLSKLLNVTQLPQYFGILRGIDKKLNVAAS